MGLSLKLCTDIINYKCNKPKPSEQWCWRRTGPATPRCPKAHLTLRPLSSSGSHCCLSQKKLSMEQYLHIFSSPPLVCHRCFQPAVVLWTCMGSCSEDVHSFIMCPARKGFFWLLGNDALTCLKTLLVNETLYHPLPSPPLVAL